MATNHKATPRKNESPERFVKRFTKNVKNLVSLMRLKTENNIQNLQQEKGWREKRQLQDTRRNCENRTSYKELGEIL